MKIFKALIFALILSALSWFIRSSNQNSSNYGILINTRIQSQTEDELCGIFVNSNGFPLSYEQAVFVGCSDHTTRTYLNPLYLAADFIIYFIVALIVLEIISRRRI